MNMNATRPARDLMHDAEVDYIQDVLTSAGIERTDREVDLGIQSAIESMTAEFGYRPNPDNQRDWWHMEPLIYEYIEIDLDGDGTISER